MTSHYYFHGEGAIERAQKFADDNQEFHPQIHHQPGRICVVLTR